MKIRRRIPKAILTILKGLSQAEINEVARFAIFVKARTAIDPTQLFFWTRDWQSMERLARRDKRLGRVLGDGTPAGLISALHK